MSGSCKPKASCFGSDIHRMLLAAEAGQKADIKTYSSGHLGPRSLIQSQPQKEKKQAFWGMSQCREENPNPLTVQQTQRTKALISIKKNEMKAYPSLSTGTTVCSSHANRRDRSLPEIVYSYSNSLPVQLRALPLKKSSPSSHPEENQQFCSSHSDQEGLNNEGQQKAKQQFGSQVIAKPDLWAGINIAEMHERKLQKELKKLSAQSWPSRDHLVVFSDVFDDVCEGSPVFGRILREIKTDYDLYVNHLMASQSSLHDTLLNASLRELGNGKEREMELEDAEKEVCRLEQEARGALEENKRARNELQNVPATLSPEDSIMKNTSLSGLQDVGNAIGHTSSIQAKRLQVSNTGREIRQLEEEIRERLVSTATTTATERHIKDLKTEIMRLIASNERLKSINKDLEKNINMVLNREKASKAIKRMLWDEIRCDIQTDRIASSASKGASLEMDVSK